MPPKNSGFVKLKETQSIDEIALKSFFMNVDQI